MKYKIIGIAACICAILLSVVTPVLANQTDTRVHQHQDATEKAACTHGEELFCTHLPLVEINTGGAEIPGKAIVNAQGRVTGYTQTADGADMTEAELVVIDNAETNNHADDAPSLASRIQIHVRGNTSRTFDKPGYDIRLITESGENNPQAMMGMDAHHRWVLHGPFLDKTLLRNYMWYNIAGEIMDYAPNVRFCEVMLNGAYQGVYVMIESITAGDDGARLDLSVDKKDNTFSGYLLRLDRGSKTEVKNISTFARYALRTDMQLNIEYPGTDNLTEELRESIRQDFSAFEKMLYSYDYDSEKYGYRNYIDVESFADYFILNEFTCNYDAGWLSTYIYRDVDGKFRMCIWDFNSACDGYQDSVVLQHHFEMQNCLWYTMLMKDEDFVETILSRYKALRKTVLSDAYLEAYIDDVVAYLGPAIDRNFEKWGYTFEPEHDRLQPANRNPRTYAEAVEQVKSFLKERSAWMDENIETLLQYSAASRTKKFNENAN